MGTTANIAINDGKGTPETHTFKPITSGPSATYRTADAALPLVGQETINTSVKRRSPGLMQVDVVLELPALETATGANSSGYTAAPKVAYSNKVKLEFFLPDRGTPAQRTDLRVLLKNLLSDAQIIDLVDNLTPSY